MLNKVLKQASISFKTLSSNTLNTCFDKRRIGVQNLRGRYIALLMILVLLYSCSRKYSTSTPNSYPLHKTSIRGPIYSGVYCEKVNKKDSLLLKGLPTTDQMDLLRVWQFEFSWPMKYYTKLLNGEINEQTFNKRNFDVGRYGNSRHRWRVFLYSARSENGKVISMDTNFDLDFSNDRKFEIPISQELKSIEDYPSFDLTYEVLSNNTIYPIDTKLSVRPYKPKSEMTNLDSYIDAMRISFSNRLEASVEVCDGSLNISFRDGLLEPQNNKLIRYRVISSELPLDTLSVMIDEPFNFKNCVCKIDKLDLIKKNIDIHSEPITNNNRFRKFVPITSQSIYSNETISTDDLSGRYQIVHFWGSWCGPCISNFPELVGFVDSLGLNIESIMGINLDNDKKVAVDIANEFNLSWENINIELNNSISILGENYIVTFPTYLIIKNGLILFKTEEFDKFKTKYLNLLEPN